MKKFSISLEFKSFASDNYVGLPLITRSALCHLFFVSLSIGCACQSYGQNPQSSVVASPDGKTQVTFEIRDFDKDKDCLSYGITCGGRRVLELSRLELQLKNDPDLKTDFRIVKVSRIAHDSTWKPLFAQWSQIRDHYNQMVVELQENSPPHRLLSLTFRAYNEGVAFRYTIPKQPNLDNFVISAEKTQFRFPGNRMNRYRPTGHHIAYATYAAQDMYQKVPLSKIRSGCERPLTVEIFDGPVVSITEAALVDYARMRLGSVRQPYNTVVSELGGEVKAESPLDTPWRVVLIADTPGRLLEQSYLILNLNEPCAVKDTSWIKPGKVYCDFVMDNDSATAAIDFCVQQNIRYLHFDAGWYGFENEPSCDASTWASPAPGWSEKPLTVEELAKRKPFDLPMIINYAKKNDVGVILYVNRRHLETQLDEILPVYHKWGIKGMKFGFVNVGSQHWTSWLHDAIRKCAQYEIMVNVHDEYRPTGYERTYPNLMTAEGILGDECFPPSHHRVTLMFTRMLTGAGDYTHPYYNYRADDSRAHKLAALVAFYSPLQYVYWYDRPALGQHVGDITALGKGVFEGGPETEFIKHIPVVWDDLRVIHGKMDDYATIARRSGRQWYIGTMNARFSQKLDIPLAFLEPNTKYLAHIYSDASPDKPRTAVRVARYIVDCSTTIEADLRPNGGHAVRLVPAKPDDNDSYLHYGNNSR